MADEHVYKELRAKAAKKMDSRLPDVREMSKQQIETALEELKIHQIELEMQNHELRLTQEKLQESQKEYTDLFDFAPVGYVVINKEKIIEKVNLTATTFLAANRSHLIGRPLVDYVTFEDRDKWFLHARELLVHGKAAAIELEMLKDDHTNLDVHLKSEPVLDLQGAVTGAKIALVDITLKKAEQALRAAHVELEKRTQQLDSSNIDLVKRTAQLSKLTSAMAGTEKRERKRLAKILHDNLQQLIAAAQIHIGVIISKTEDKLVQESAGEVRQLLTESIETSRSLAIDLSPTILHESGLIASLSWLCRWIRKQYQFTVTLETAPDADTNNEDIKVLVFESVRELLFNAVKHAGVSEATVKLNRTLDGIEVIVSDMGRGFDKSALCCDADQSEFKFGLFSLQERLDLYNGLFRIDSSPGKGSIFTMTLPLELESIAKDIALSSKKKALLKRAATDEKKIHVLLVDDHTVVRQGIAALLKRDLDIAITGEAADGQQAVEIARQIQPDVILMDYNMPKLNGVEATRIIHAEQPAVRIIGLSMYDEAELAQAMKDAGAAAFLNKAGPVEELLGEIKKQTCCA